MFLEKANIWKNFDLDQAISLRQWLMSSKLGLNLTLSDESYDNDNFIHYIEIYQPPKDLALSYLNNHSVQIPQYAHAIIHHGPEETIRDYLIGPLPISNETIMKNITYLNPIPLNARNTFNWTILAEYGMKLLLPLEPVFNDLFNASLVNQTILPAATGPMSYDGKWRRSWVQMRYNVAGSWLHAVDFQFYVDLSGTDPNKYHIIKIMHDSKIYHSVEEIIIAWKQGLLKRFKPDLSSWASRQIRGRQRDLDDRQGPRSVQFSGPRFRVDIKEDWVSWMGWNFYLSFERDMGLHFWDIRFKDERIIYELSPQEAMSQYSGSDPHQASTVWLDSSFGMGGSVREVILGYDCPTYSMMLNATIHELGSSVRKNAICIFERESDRPLSRHFGEQDGESGVVKGYELVVRTITTVGNYDYLFDYTFMLDGTIEIRLSASGYLQGGIWQQSQIPYGHRIHQGAVGSLHDHVINYKIDFDIVGTKNSFMQVKLETEKVDQEWMDEDWGVGAIQQRMTKNILPYESLLEWPNNMEGAYVITNQDEKNAWGHSRGYTIHPGPLCHLTNLESKRTEKNVNWAKQHLAVSRRKEEERCSSSIWNGNLPGAPPVDFYKKFFDDESIEQEDLVVWVNLGTHHIPRAEDSPNTLTNLATSYVLLSPWNYHDYDPSIDSRNSVILKNDGHWHVDEATKPGHCIPSAPEPLVYSGLESYREDGSPGQGELGNWLLGVMPGRQGG
ncbi:hypothetical protein M231_07497 [Tremella mesenterica]|uniref:Amine oxidase n=1 Tax=Tremella mesenterica TaxID=5217 RepID=A0A4Q1BFR9_TREME|nr:hypothetical protein M231_07497 [Tremella mesenterica]